MRKPLTTQQQAVLRTIMEYIDANGISPTFEEIAQRRGLSKVTVHGHVNELVSKGWVTSEKDKARSIVIAEGVVMPGSLRDRLGYAISLMRKKATIEGTDERYAEGLTDACDTIERATNG